MGLEPPPGWEPPSSAPADASLPPPPPFKVRKSNSGASATSQDASTRAGPPQHRRDPLDVKRKRRRAAPARLKNPERLRSIIERHRDLGSAQANADKASYLGALKYLPHAVFKVLENMPQPWEASKQVTVLYHTAGAITFVDEIPYVDPLEFMSRWGQAWTDMRDEKRDRTSFRRMRLPPFDDEETPLTWRQLNTFVDELPDPVPARPVASIFDGLRHAEPFLLNATPPLGFDHASFINAKALHIQVPNGPRFEDQSELSSGALPPSSLDDPNQIIVRPQQFPLRAETQVVYPVLYGGGAPRTKVVHPLVVQPLNAIIKRHDTKKAFFLDSSITEAPAGPVAPPNGGVNRSSAAGGDIGPTPFLADVQFDDEEVAQARACYHAGYPFNQAKRKRQRAQDIALVKPLYTRRRPLRVMASKTRGSYQRLLKSTTKLALTATKRHHTPDTGRSRRIFGLLGSTKFFERTRIDWLEAGMQLCHQGYQILQLLIHRRGLHFMHLDYNFNLKPTKTLTTKERKRSRFGNSFHLVREMLKMIKLIIDSHIQFRLGKVDAFELADGLHYILTHIGQLTGLYRYKYRVMHQITACNDLKHVIYDRFNMNGVGKGPGCGVWQPSWRVWLGFLRGNLPMLERWLGNLITRQFYGRVSKGIAKTVTKQRIESHYDLELRASVLHDILDVMPEQLRKSKTKVVMQHLSEAWRCWKANIPWDVPGMPEPIKRVIERYIQSRAEHWIKVLHTNRERIRAGRTVDKAVARKNLGRLTRLWLRGEQERQSKYAQTGPLLTPEEAVIIYKTAAAYLRAREFLDPIVLRDDSSFATDSKLLTLALENIRADYNMTARLTNTQREELLSLEQAYDNPYDTLARIKKAIQTQRVFKNIEVSLLDLHDHLCPVYHVAVDERIVDAYVDQYLWYEASKRGLFPDWVKPSDDEVAPIMVRKFCEKLNKDTRFWSTTNGDRSTLLHVKLSRFVENADLTLLNQLLKLVLDESLADYITAKMNSALTYKDMSHVQQVGIIRGFEFSSFVVQYYLLMIDLLFLGLRRALQLSGAHEPRVDAHTHPICDYLRNVDDVYIMMHLTPAESKDLLSDFKDELTHDLILADYPVKHCWPYDQMMQLVRADVQLGRAAFAEFRGRIPESLGTVSCVDASVLSSSNPAVMFEMAGFEVRMQKLDNPGLKISQIGETIDDNAAWVLRDSDASSYGTSSVFLKVSDESINRFNNRVRQILMSSGSTTFAKIIKRWNTTLTALAAYFREAAIATPRLLEVIVKNETRVQNKVKMGLNSKMPARFPPCVFYSPEELGGLGMLSASHVLIPESDLYGRTHSYKHGMGDFKDAGLIPNLFRYISTWEAEAHDSQRVWAEYAQKRSDAIATNSRVTLDELEDIWHRGLPRISTLFQKDKAILAYDKGFRSRLAFKNFSNAKYDPFWWVSTRHDGRLWNFSDYRNDVIEALGGINTILEHTLFKATGFDNWEGLFWQKQSGFEQQMQLQKLTNAQRSGLSQIPNRRFTLWWSPTINRANVYVGFLVQLDLTGIFLHGKIPTLKISYIQVFRAHLWQKIHESLVVDMCHIFDREQSALALDGVEKLPIHPRKSYRMNASTADILLTSSNAAVGWAISKPSLLNADGDKFDHSSSAQFWIDIQLRYGDFDSHDITRYTRAKFLDYTSDGVSLYPSSTGLMVCVDLAYNTYDAYGHWFPGLKELMRQAMQKLMQSNPALHIFRERVRKALQLFQSQPSQPHLTSGEYTDLIDSRSLVVDDTSVYRVTTKKTKNGNMTTKPINGALFCLNAATGQLYCTLVHADATWAGQKKLSALSKWKAAEGVANTIRTLPDGQRPGQVVISTRGLRDPMEVNMLEFSDISVRNSEFSFPLSALLGTDTFKALMDNVIAQSYDRFPKENQFTFGLYDDWLKVCQPSTAFSRLALLLRGLAIDADSLMTILSQKSLGRPPVEGFFWPKLSRETWTEVEDLVSDLIVEHYARTNAISRDSLTQSEIRDIIMGQAVTPPSEDSETRALETNTAVEGQGKAVTTKSHNVHGDEITVVTTSKYEQQTFESQGTWRNRALEAASSLHYRALHLHVDPALEQPYRALVPRNLLRDFAAVCDTRNLVMALVYGYRDAESRQFEVVSLGIVPQLGSTTNISFSSTPSHEDLPDGSGLQLLGVVRSQTRPRSDKDISPVDLMMLASRQRELTWCAFPALVLTLNLEQGVIGVQGFVPTEAGVRWGAKNRDLLSDTPTGYDGPSFASKVAVAITSDSGFFYVPQDDIWNYSFMNTMWNPKMRAFVKIGLPVGYYDSIHRPQHFSRMGKLEDGFEFEEQVF